jgi:hypothetical protein
MHLDEPLRRIWVRGLAAVLVLGLASGCNSPDSDGSAATPGETAQPDLPTTQDPSQNSNSENATPTNSTSVPSASADQSAVAALPSLALPFGGELRRLYGMSSNDRKFVFDAVQQARAACMADRGFELQAFPFVADTGRPPHDLAVSLEYRQDRGYLPPPDPAADISPEEQAALDQADADPEFAEALAGPDDDPLMGCNAIANRQVFGAVEVNPFESLAQLDNMDSDAQLRALASDAMTPVIQAWSACMASNGIEYESRSQLEEAQWPDPRPSETERATAAADFNCMTESGYRETYSEQYLTMVATVEAEQQATLDGYRAEQQELVDAAKSYLQVG